MKKIIIKKEKNQFAIEMGKLGGRANVLKHGTEHMQRIRTLRKSYPQQALVKK